MNVSTVAASVFRVQVWSQGLDRNENMIHCTLKAYLCLKVISNEGLKGLTAPCYMLVHQDGVFMGMS